MSRLEKHCVKVPARAPADHRDADRFHRHNIVNFGCGHMTLEEDVTFTGTPPPMNAGDLHTIDIERIGVPRNSLVFERR